MKHVKTFERFFSEGSREKLADKGHALPDGSFPIENEKDLKNAIKAHGRAKDVNKAKAHIKKRAKALGKEDLIPENWLNENVEHNIDPHSMMVGKQYKLIKPYYDDFSIEPSEPEIEMVEVVKKMKYGLLLKVINNTELTEDLIYEMSFRDLMDCKIECLEDNSVW